MSNNVIQFPGFTKLPTDPDDVLRAPLGELETAVVIGWTHDGTLWAASSHPDGGDVLWLLEKTKQLLLRLADDMETDD